MLEYSKRVLELFADPPKAGKLENPSSRGLAGQPGASDYCYIDLAIEAERIVKARFRCEGCPAAIACASAACQLAEGLDLDGANELTPEQIIDFVGGLPEEKEHCAELALDALQDALWRYVFQSVETPH